MNLISKETLKVNTTTFKVEFDSEEFNAAIEKIYKRDRARIQLPGFRKGKATRKLIEAHYGEGVFHTDAINELLKEHVPKLVEEQKLDIVDTPAATSAEVTDKKTVIAEIDCTTKPDVTVTQYKGLAAPKQAREVTDEDILSFIDKEREERARVSEITDRPAELGDEVTIDFRGSVDGVKFDGGEAFKYPLTIGKKTFIDGFEDQIIGHNIGEEFDINVTFPEDYQMTELAGKAAVFAIKIHSISAIELPELDDEFAKDVSEFETLDQYKADVRKNLEDQAENEAQNKFENEIFEKVIETVEGEIPQCMYEQRIDSIVRDFSFRLRQQNLNFSTYLEYLQMTLEDFREQYSEQAEGDVKLRLAFEKIAELEGFDVTDEEIEKSYAEIAEKNNSTIEKFKELITLDLMKSDLRVKKASEFVVSNSVVDNSLAVEEAVANIIDSIDNE